MSKTTAGARRRAWMIATAGLGALGLALASAPAAGAAPTKPGQPNPPTITAGNRSVRATFTAPTNGGSKITGYRVKCTATGGKTRQHDGPKSPIKVDGLTAGKDYTCTVAARNKVGLGPA